MTNDDEKKSTKIDISPQAIRGAAGAAMLLAGFQAEATRPILDGTYDLEYLQRCYEQAAGFGSATATLALIACEAWARVIG